MPPGAARPARTGAGSRRCGWTGSGRAARSSAGRRVRPRCGPPVLRCSAIPPPGPSYPPRRGSLPPPGTRYRSLHLTSHRLDSALMLDELRIAAVIPAYNEARRLGHLIPAIPRDLVDEVIVVNDQSTDGTAEVARELGAYVIDREERGGPGPGIRSALDVLRNGEGPKADVVVVMAANGKHDPAQIIDLVRPIAEEKCDLVRGSRFLDGGMHVHMPWHRLALIQVFTFLARLSLRQKITDATGGYQAYRLSVLDDPTIDLHQPWLGRYEVETYL